MIVYPDIVALIVSCWQMFSCLPPKSRLICLRHQHAMSGCVLRFFLNLPRHWSNWKRKIQLVIPSWWIQTPKPEPKEWKEMRCHLVSMPVLVCSLSITRIHAWEEDDLHWFRKKFGWFLMHPGAFKLLLQCVSSSPCSSPSYLNHLKMALHSFAWYMQMSKTGEHMRYASVDFLWNFSIGFPKNSMGKWLPTSGPRSPDSSGSGETNWTWRLGSPTEKKKLYVGGSACNIGP